MDKDEIEIDFKNDNINISLDSKDNIEIEIDNNQTVNTGTNDYEKLKNQPKINTITLLGNKTSKDLKLQDEMNRITNSELETLFEDL